METLQSQEWSQAHQDVNEALSSLLNEIRDLGYNPSLHIRYDGPQHRLMLEESLVDKHPNLAASYQRYIDACDRRDAAVEKIQELPKLDIGF